MSSKPSRAELAAAGRRKLEEFRRQKAAAAAARAGAAGGEAPSDGGGVAGPVAAAYPPVPLPSGGDDGGGDTLPSLSVAPAAQAASAAAAPPAAPPAGPPPPPGAAPAVPPAAEAAAWPPLFAAPQPDLQRDVRPSWLQPEAPEATAAAGWVPAHAPPSQPQPEPSSTAPALVAAQQNGPLSEAAAPSALTAQPAFAPGPAELVTQSSGASDAASAEGSRQGSRLPPPMPRLFDWRSLGSKQQQQGAQPAAAPAEQQLQQQQSQEKATLAPSPTFPPPAAAAAAPAEGSSPSTAAPAAAGDLLAPAAQSLTAQQAAAPAAGAAETAAPPAAGDTEDSAEAALQGDAEQQLGSPPTQHAWADRLQSGGSRGGLFASLFGRKPSGSALPAEQQPGTEHGTTAGAAGDMRISGSVSEQPAALADAPGIEPAVGPSVAAGASEELRGAGEPANSDAPPLSPPPRPPQPRLASGYAALADAYADASSADSAAPAAAAPGSVPPAAGVEPLLPPLGKPPAAPGSFAAGYGALADAYLAPELGPAVPAGPSKGQLGATATAGSSRSSSFISGYAQLSDRYAAGSAAAGGGDQPLQQAQQGQQQPVTPAPSLASMAGAGAAAQGASTQGRSLSTLGAALAGLGGSSAPSSSSASLADADKQPAQPGAAAAAAADTGGGGSAAQGAAAAALAGQAQPQGKAGASVWAAPAPLPPRVPSTSSMPHFTPPQSRGNDFKALQQHIQELTEDKFTLQRGLEHQARLAGTLADENEALVQRYNEQAKHVQALHREVGQLQQALAEQAAAVERAAAERDAYKLSAQEAQQRAQSLAAEVVRLEDSVLKLRSNELRVGREAEGATEVVRAMRSQLEAVTRERAGLLTQLDGLRGDNTELRVRLREAQEAANAAAAAGAAAGAVQQPAAAPPLGGEAPAASAQPAPAAAAAWAADAAPAPAAAAAEVDEASPSPGPAAVRNVSAALARAALAGAARRRGRAGLSSEEGLTEGEEDELSEEEAGSPTAALIPAELLPLLPARAAGGSEAGAAGDDAMLALVQSIYLLLSALEVDKQQLVGVLNAKQDELASLHGANRQLAARLEAQQQRMELLSQQLSLQHAAQQQQPVVNGVAIGMPPGANGRAQPPAAKGGWAAGTHAVAVARRPGLHYLS